MQSIINYYNQLLELIPMQYRIVIAVIVLIFLVYALISFFRKNWFWIIVFVILLPAAWPALRQIGLALWQLMQKIPK